MKYTGIDPETRPESKPFLVFRRDDAKLNTQSSSYGIFDDNNKLRHMITRPRLLPRKMYPPRGNIFAPALHIARVRPGRDKSNAPVVDDALLSRNKPLFQLASGAQTTEDDTKAKPRPQERDRVGGGGGRQGVKFERIHRSTSTVQSSSTLRSTEYVRSGNTSQQFF